MISQDTTENPQPIEAVLFDMDGVITDTAEAHMAAWKRLFDAFLREHDAGAEPFTQTDYRRHVDGKPRHEGVKDFLASRGIELPFGEPDDGSDAQTVCGLGNRKNGHFRAWLRENAVEAFPGSRAFLAELEAAGIRAAVFSSSRNAADVLASAGVLDRFEVKVDGRDMTEAGLPGKPDPAIMLRAADGLGMAPGEVAIVEDAIAGVEAGAAGGFAQVVGVARADEAAALEEAGASLVVADLAELAIAPGPRLVARTTRSTPLVWDAREAFAARMSGKRLAVFLDYDGVLTPIVEDPDEALLGQGMREALSSLAARVPVAIVSGRDLEDVCEKVGDDTLYYAGSHGFDLAGPDGWSEVVEAGKRFLPALRSTAAALEERLAPIHGARVENKRFSLAIHFRQVAEAEEEAVKKAVRETVADQQDLSASAGKKVFDVKPRLDWHKGRAVLSLLNRLDLHRDDVLPIYFGDDTTDEDAFRSISDRGLGIVVRDGTDRRTAARFALAGTDDVERLLRWLAAEAAGKEAR